MTKDEIIQMACDCFGGIIKQEERQNFIRFAKLVAEKEREECAKLADVWVRAYDHPSEAIARSIRAREQS